MINTTAANPLGTGTITMSGGTLTGNTSLGAITIPNNVVVTAGTVSSIIANVSGTFSGNAYAFSGAITGSGTLQTATTNAGNVSLIGDLSGFTGTLLVQTVNNQENFQFNGTAASTLNLGQANVVLTGATGSNRRFGVTVNNETLQIGALASAVGTGSILGNNGAFFEVGGLNTDTSYGGNFIGNNSFGLIKVGTGTLTFNTNAGAGSYTGPTAVNGGMLVLDFFNSTSGINLISSGSTRTALRLAGGTLDVKGSPTITTSQTFLNLTVNQGGSAVVVEGNGALGTLVPLQSISARAPGSTVNFVLPAGAKQLQRSHDRHHRPAHEQQRPGESNDECCLGHGERQRLGRDERCQPGEYRRPGRRIHLQRRRLLVGHDQQCGRNHWRHTGRVHRQHVEIQ